MSDWDEIKRLAADFQRTQTSDTLQRLSERNVIDIIKKLTDLNLIELIYTCDGKEFITPSHLSQEIEDEIFVNGGRMQLHDLAARLNVDYQHVENSAKELATQKPDEYSLILGQVIHSTYKVTLGKLINDCMLTSGQLSIADFSKSLDLPSEFLSAIVKEILPKVLDDYIVGQDGRTYYTTDMMDRYKSMIVGTLSALLKPTSIASIMKRLDIPERIFLPIVESQIKEGRLDAFVENRMFIPAIHSREQNDWISKFYKSNHYIEYDVLSRMDIKQPKVFLKKSFPDGIPLKTCIVSPSLLSQVEFLIEDCIASNGWIDISTIVPPAIETEDIELMLAEIFKRNKQFGTSCLIFNQINVCSPGFVASCRNSISKLMDAKAQEHLKQGKLMNYFMGGKIKEITKKTIDTSRKGREDSPDDSPKDADKHEENKPVAFQEKPVSQNVAAEMEEESAQDSSKGKRGQKKSKPDLDELSDTEQGGKKSKGRKSGGGLVGREVKQKAVKKKYMAGHKSGNISDEDTPQTKGPRSNKGRAARRGISPEPEQRLPKTKGALLKSDAPQKEPLIFMHTAELIDKLRIESRDGSEEFLESIAQSIESDLNREYEVLAKKTLDDFLRSQEESYNEHANDAVVDLVE